MKRLEELGICPAPWTCEVNEDEQLVVYDACGHVIGQCFESDNDASLFAAAPKLYKWLAFAVEHYKCETRACDKCPNGKCWIVDATAALAEAAGESEAK